MHSIEHNNKEFMNDQDLLKLLKTSDKLALVALVSKIPVPIAILDECGIFLGANQSFADIYERDALFLLKKKLNTFSTVVYVHFNNAIMAFNQNKTLQQIENEFYSKGHFFILYFKVMRNAELDIDAVTVVCADITRLKRHERVLLQNNKRLHDHLYIDQVTGLKNKLAFERFSQDHLNQKNCKDYSFIKIDLDDFKKFNQLNSYTYGDEILSQIGASFSEELANDHAQLFRLNSASFIVVLEHTTPWTVRTIAERLRQKIIKENIYFNELSEEILTITLGIYHPKPFENFVEVDLMQQLDDAVNQAKLQGKNSIFVVE